MKKHSFYQFYQKILREQDAPTQGTPREEPELANTNQPQASAGQAPPAPNTATPQAPPASNTSAATAPPVPDVDPAVQQLQQKLKGIAPELGPIINKIQDQQIKDALGRVLTVGGGAPKQMNPQTSAMPTGTNSPTPSQPIGQQAPNSKPIGQ